MSDDTEGVRVARRVARWHIGDPSWADLIIGAYKDPVAYEQRLEDEISEGKHHDRAKHRADAVA